MEMIDTYIDAGFQIIPIEPGGKKSLVRWKKQVVSPHPKALQRTIFSSTYYDESNIGIICGAVSGGLVVLDFDEPLAYHRMKRQLPDTFTVETRRGYHVYLRVLNPPDHSFSLDGLDVKASGYVVAPPSVHQSGHVYKPTSPINGDLQIATVNSLDDLGIEQPQRVEFVPDDDAPPLYGGSSLIANIKAVLPISTWLARHTELYPSDRGGGYLMARCPYHDDRRPSMWVRPAWGRCKCFAGACAAGQRALDVVDAYALLHYRQISRDTVAQAVNNLAAELGL